MSSPLSTICFKFSNSLPPKGQGEREEGPNKGEGEADKEGDKEAEKINDCSLGEDDPENKGGDIFSTFFSFFEEIYDNLNNFLLSAEERRRLRGRIFSFNFRSCSERRERVEWWDRRSETDIGVSPGLMTGKRDLD